MAPTRSRAEDCGGVDFNWHGRTPAAAFGHKPLEFGPPRVIIADRDGSIAVGHDVDR